MYFTYIIQSESSNRFYIGSTGNLDDRLQRHNQDRSLATKSMGPWKLVFSKTFLTRSEAIALESKIKKRGAHRFLDDLKVSG